MSAATAERVDANPNLARGRFDVVVFNYERLGLFFDNFEKIRGFDIGRDRLTVVSCSPSEAETAQVREFEARSGIPVRYLTRENRGIEQLARCEYYTGRVGRREENLACEYVFQMQEHYLDTASPAARWGPELDFRMKSDVVPDGLVFDLDRIEDLGEQHRADGFFADRANPCFMELEGRRYVAPCGGNFIIRSSRVAEPPAQAAIRRVMAACDDSYEWAVFAEFMWGRIFFPEGRRFYDLKRERLFDRWEEDLFYVAPDDYPALIRKYDRGRAASALRGGVERIRSATGRALAASRRR